MTGLSALVPGVSDLSLYPVQAPRQPLHHGTATESLSPPSRCSRTTGKHCCDFPYFVASEVGVNTAGNIHAVPQKFTEIYRFLSDLCLFNQGFYALIKKLQKLSFLLKNVFLVDCLGELNSIRSLPWPHVRLPELVCRVRAGRAVRTAIKKRGCDNLHYFLMIMQYFSMINHLITSANSEGDSKCHSTKNKQNNNKRSTGTLVKGTTASLRKQKKSRCFIVRCWVGSRVTLTAYVW